MARRFENAGAPWIHVVDLDAARTGDPRNRALVAAVVAAVGVPVQVSGGVRDEHTAAELHEAGAARVVIGTAALEDPDLVARVARRQPVAIGLDVRGRTVAVRGWTRNSQRDWGEVLASLDDTGAEAVVSTQIDREGLMAGPDRDGLRELLAATELDVIASGGVRDLEDLRALATIEIDGRRLSGTIVGTATYAGNLDVAAAVEVLQCAPRA
jgi:phosphoribosylformimino-5-aminoimidazole carboxamide ribotide isomerase